MDARDDVIELAPATAADIDFLFALKSEPDSVYWGGFARAPEYSTLKNHYEKVFELGTKTTLVVRYLEQPAGVISYRFDDNGDCTDYSINVSARFAGRGVGRAALEKDIAGLRASRPACRRIVALIRDDNPRSQRIFAAAGYESTEDYEERVLDSDRKPIRLQAWVRNLA
jgi:RimJ/RimL family protein N-acetyltransferase